MSGRVAVPPAGTGMFHTPFSSFSPGDHVRNCSGFPFLDDDWKSKLPPACRHAGSPLAKVRLAAERPVDAHDAALDGSDLLIEPDGDPLRSLRPDIGREGKALRQQPCSLGFSPARDIDGGLRVRLFYRESGVKFVHEARRGSVAGVVFVSGMHGSLLLLVSFVAASCSMTQFEVRRRPTPVMCVNRRNDRSLKHRSSQVL